MDYKKIEEFQIGERVDGFYLIKTSTCKTSSNNKSYLDITLADKTGEINAKLWDSKEEDESKYAKNNLVKVRGSISEWLGKKQFRIEKIRLVNTEDDIDINDFVPSAPVSAESMYREVLDYIDRIENQDIKNLVTYIIDSKKDKLIYYPAAMKNHHSVRSGLLYHIKRMLNLGERVAEVYALINTDLLIAGVILHDMAKIEEMDSSELGIVSDYTVEGQLLGHIIQGVKDIDKAAEVVGLDKETSLLLQHMILSHHYEPEFGSPKKPMIPEGEILHYLDTIDASMYDMEKALKDTEIGQLSDRVWSLDNRKIYKAQLKK